MAVEGNLFAARSFEKVRLPPQQAEPLPHWAYTSAQWYEREVERIFRKGWNYVGHVSQVPKPGDFFTLDVAGIPLIVVRGQDDVVRAFFNSCRHRGSKLLWGEGNCKLIRCPYHAWAYNLAGGLVATPLVDEDMEGIKSELSLHAPRLEIIDGFLMVAFNDVLPPASKALGSLQQEWAGYDPANFVCTRRKSWDVKANWKLWYENYNDSLHVPFVHPGSLAKQKVKSRQRASHVETDGIYIAHFTVHAGSRGLLEEDQDKAPTIRACCHPPCSASPSTARGPSSCIPRDPIAQRWSPPPSSPRKPSPVPILLRRRTTTTAASTRSCPRTTRPWSGSRKVCACRWASPASSPTWRRCATPSTTGSWTRWSTPDTGINEEHSSA
jgi:phenylpropionate dioxygenase-like ring-hydroxylating dioxygenase large terminal subunit